VLKKHDKLSLASLVVPANNPAKSENLNSVFAKVECLHTYNRWYGSAILKVCYSESPSFPLTLTPTLTLTDPNPKLKLNPSTVARICTMDFRNSGIDTLCSVHVYTVHNHPYTETQIYHLSGKYYIQVLWLVVATTI